MQAEELYGLKTELYVDEISSLPYDFHFLPKDPAAKLVVFTSMSASTLYQLETLHTALSELLLERFDPVRLTGCLKKDYLWWGRFLRGVGEHARCQTVVLDNDEGAVKLARSFGLSRSILKTGHRWEGPSPLPTPTR